MNVSYLQLAANRVLRSLWFTPAAYALLAILALVFAPAAARYLPKEAHSLIGLDGIDDLLGVLASTLLAVAIFSLGIMVSSLQASATATTPRARPLLAQDRTAQNAISVFIGGFIFAIVGIAGLSTSYYAAPSRVILFLVTCFVITSVIYALIRWIGRLSRLGNVSEVIDLLEKAAHTAFEDLAQQPAMGGQAAEAMPEDGFAVSANRFGFVQAIDVSKLGRLAEKHGIDLYLAARPGAYVDPSRALMIATHPLDAAICKSICDTFVIGGERTFEADPRFCLIVLSETASKALSPGINDPGTAIDVVGTTLRILADWSSEARKSAQAVAYPHLHVPHISVDDIVIDAFRWIARDAAGHLEVQIRIIRALASLNAFDAPRFGEATRMMAQESLGRARDALESRKDIELLEDVYRQSGLAPVE